MLITRVITAVVLLLVLGAVLTWGGLLGWTVFVGVLMAAAFWEWARLHPMDNPPSLGYAAIGLCVFAALVSFNGSPGLFFVVMTVASVFWVALAPWCLRNVGIGVLQQRGLFLGVGLFLISGAGLALVLAKQVGVVFLLSVMAICWAADIFAYVFGRLFGKRKLAPQISPGKSWEGAVGGAATVLVLSWLVIWYAPQWPVLEQTWQVQAHNKWHPVWFSVWLLVLSAFSVVGDLFESLLKRRVGFKDSSRLLPGHGGVLDRIDAQLPVMPLAMLLVGATGA